MHNTEISDKKVYLLTFLYTSLTILNLLLMDTSVLMIITSFQALLLMFFIFKKDIRNAFFWHCIFTIACFNLGAVAIDAQTINTYAKAKLVGPLTLNYIILGLLWLSVRKKRIAVDDKSLLLRIRKLLVLFMVSGTTIGLIGLIFNNSYSIKYLIENLLYIIIAFLYIDIFLRLYSESFSKCFAVSTICMITASSISAFISFTFLGIRATYSVDETFIYNPIYNLIPCLIIALFQLKGTAFKVISIIGLLFFGFGAMIMSRGSTFLTAFVALLLLIYMIYFKKTDTKQIKSLRVILPILLFLGIPSLITLALSGSQISINKFNQFISLFELLDFSQSFNIRLISVGQSPYIRIAEVINIIDNGFNNIFTLFFGNGYGGYFTDSLQLFANIDLSQGAYSDDMIRTGCFYKAHSVYPCAILFNGLIGLYMLLKLGFSYLYHIDKTFLVFAAFILFMYGFYFDIIGLASYLTALFGAEYMINNKGHEKSLCC